MTNREAMKIALDEMARYQVKSGDFDRFDNVIKNLRQALAQPEQPMTPEHLPKYIATNNVKPMEGGGGGGAQREQKPVALKMVYGEVCYQSKHDDQSFGMWCPITEREFPNGTPFYTEPSKREWVGLTGREIELVLINSGYSAENFARAIEAKLKEKNT